IMLLVSSYVVVDNAIKVEDEILPKNFKTTITYMSPSKYPSASVTDFSFEMRGDTVELHLPYMGEVYSASFDNEGLNFAEPFKITHHEINSKKQRETIEIETRHKSISYKLNITGFDNGTMDIVLFPSNAESCSYRGTWEKSSATK
ncbi:MAG: DUF4251 domain-containing protein, partial [Prevotellaceae bacterium]|nr:DUF4251 domain-containing protein [Candidatus Colivivens equi]